MLTIGIKDFGRPLLNGPKIANVLASICPVRNDLHDVVIEALLVFHREVHARSASPFVG